MYQVNFLPWRIIQLQARYRFWCNSLLIQSLVIVAGVLIILWLWVSEKQQQRILLITLSQQQATLGKAYEITKNNLMKLKKIKLLQQAHQLAQLHTQRYLVLLQQLSLLIPDSCWVTSIEEHNDVLVLVAISDNYAAIIIFLQQLSESGYLGNIRLGDVNKSDHSKYHFVIHADWQSREQYNE